jgi:cytochrome c biogenesis protein CcmG/thiol:disulfide interchange protein DsbE
VSRWLRLLPIVLLALVLAALVWRLANPEDTTIRSRLAGKPVPQFTLPPAVPGKPGLASADLAKGQPRLLNVFASWCVPCAAKAPNKFSQKFLRLLILKALHNKLSTRSMQIYANNFLLYPQRIHECSLFLERFPLAKKFL